MASDRYKILSDGIENVELSAQHLLSCVPNQNGCRGGSLDKAWNFFRKSGYFILKNEFVNLKIIYLIYLQSGR